MGKQLELIMLENSDLKCKLLVDILVQCDIKSSCASSNTSISFHRVDPTIGTDNVKDTPIQLAAERPAVEILTLFAEYAKNPAGIKAKLLKLIIESDGKQDASLDAFKQQLESLSASEVTSYSW